MQTELRNSLWPPRVTPPKEINTRDYGFQLSGKLPTPDAMFMDRRRPGVYSAISRKNTISSTNRKGAAPPRQGDVWVQNCIYRPALRSLNQGLVNESFQ